MGETKYVIIGAIFVVLILAGFFFYLVKIKKISLFNFLHDKEKNNITDIYIKAYDYETGNQIGIKYILRNKTKILSSGNLDSYASKKVSGIPIGMNLTLLTYGRDSLYNYYHIKKKFVSENNTHIETRNYREGSLAVVETEKIDGTDFIMFTVESMEMIPYGYVNYPMYCVGWKEPILEISIEDFTRVTVPERLLSKVDRCFVREKPYFLKPYQTEVLNLKIRKTSDKLGNFTIYAIDRASYCDGFDCSYRYEYGNEDIGATDFVASFKV